MPNCTNCDDTGIVRAGPYVGQCPVCPAGGMVTPKPAPVEISLEHMQRLSRVFNEGCNLHTRNDQQINEWLKYQISLRA